MIEIKTSRKLHNSGYEVHSKTEYVQEQRDTIKQLVQECENLKEDYKELEQRHNEAFQDFERLKKECEEQEQDAENWAYKAGLATGKASSYLKALEEIEIIAKDGLNPICYKSNCSRCQCYDGDDCNARMNALINNYFTDGEFFDDYGDFAEEMEALLVEERISCNKAKPISQQILDIISKAKGEE